MQAAILGAGIMGRVLGATLKNAGWQVTLFDKNSKSSCSAIAAGLLTPLSELDKAEPIIYQLGQTAIDHDWPLLLKNLNAIYFKKMGSIAISHPHDQAEFDFLIKKLPSKNLYKTLTTTEIQQLEPELTKFSHAIYFSNEGQIDAQAVFQALGNYLQTNICNDIPNHKSYDITIDCRGLAARDVFNTLRGIRGEILWLHAPAVNITRPIRLYHPRYPLYIVPRPQSVYLIGASEIESEDVSPISVKSTLDFLTAAYSVHPGFAEARILKSYTHCRPTLPNHLPTIQFAKRFLAINGLYRHGYLISPTLAKEVLRWLNQEPLHYPSLWEECYDYHLH